MTRTLGTYYFRQRHNNFIIERVVELEIIGRTGQAIKEVRTYEEAVTETYRLNGWGVPKNIKRNF